MLSNRNVSSHIKDNMSKKYYGSSINAVYIHIISYSWDIDKIVPNRKGHLVQFPSAKEVLVSKFATSIFFEATQSYFLWSYSALLIPAKKTHEISAGAWMESPARIEQLWSVTTLRRKRWELQWYNTNNNNLMCVIYTVKVINI